MMIAMVIIMALLGIIISRRLTRIMVAYITRTVQRANARRRQRIFAMVVMKLMMPMIPMISMLPRIRTHP